MKIFDLLKKGKKNIMMFTQSNNFKGYKKIGIISHGNQTAEKNLKALYSEKLNDKQIRIEQFTYSNNESFHIYFNNMLIGTIFPDTSAAKPEAINALLNGKISEAYVKIDEITTLEGKRYSALLFIKIED